MERPIRNAAKALIMKDGKMLVIRIKDNDEEWYIMPGGGQEEEELLIDAVLHRDTNQIGYAWIDIHNLNHSKLYPSKLRRQIMNLYEGKPYKVYLGNEEVGDPECLE